MDFGIANEKQMAGMTFTGHGLLVGTPAYLAPERINGERADEKADIYALGIVLYEMLTGDVPFSANTPAAMLIKHLQEVPLPLREFRSDIPASVEGVVMQALEKDPQKRQSDVGKIAVALRKAASKLVVETDIQQTLVLREWTVGRVTDSIPQGRKTKRTEQKSKWKVGGATIAIAATFVLGALGTGWIVSSQGKPLTSLIEKWRKVDTDSTTVNSANPVTPGTIPGHEDALADERRVKEQYLPEAQEAENAGEWEEAKQNYEKALEIDPDDKSLVSALNRVNEQINKLDKEVQQLIKVGNFYFNRGQYKEAIVEFEKAKVLQPRKQEILSLLQRAQSAWDTEKKLGVALSQ
jgi:serine/threonine protein kinase